MMTDPQVRQLAEQLAKIFGFNCKPEDNCAECPCHIEEAAEFLAAFASHTRREALREAEEVVMDKANASLHENLPPTRECGICKGLRIGAAAIRLLAEESNENHS